MDSSTGNIEILKSKTVYGHSVKIEEIPLAVFLGYPECDVQRDTEGRAKKAFRSHLKADSPLHALVFLAEMPDGKRYIIDACTRRYLWEQGAKAPVDTVTAYTVACSGIEDARQFYYHLDNPTAVDRSSDVAFGQLRAQAVQPKSEMVRRSGYLSGLKKAFNGARKDLVEHTAPLLLSLDSLGLRNRALPAGALAAFFLTVYRFGAGAMPFWNDLVSSKGIADEEGRTPPLALAWRIQKLRETNRLTGDRNVTALMEMSLALFMEWGEKPDWRVPDTWHATLKRDVYIRAIRSENASAAELFDSPRKIRAGKPTKDAGATKYPRKTGKTKTASTRKPRITRKQDPQAEA